MTEEKDRETFALQFAVTEDKELLFFELVMVSLGKDFE